MSGQVSDTTKPARLTAEREAEIRGFLVDVDDGVLKDVAAQLLAEIDALRAELAALRGKP